MRPPSPPTSSGVGGDGGRTSRAEVRGASTGVRPASASNSTSGDARPAGIAGVGVVARCGDGTGRAAVLCPTRPVVDGEGGATSSFRPPTASSSFEPRRCLKRSAHFLPTVG